MSNFEAEKRAIEYRLREVKLRLSIASPYPWEVVMGRQGNMPRFEVVSKSDTRDPKAIITHVHAIHPHVEANPNWSPDLGLIKHAPEDLEFLISVIERFLLKPEPNEGSL